MIINQSNINFSSFSENNSSLKINQQINQLTNSPSNNSANSTWQITNNSALFYSAREESKFQSSSKITNEKGEVSQSNIIVASKKLTAISLKAEAAQIAIRKTFPTEKPAKNSQIQGMGALEFKQQIQYQQNSQNIFAASGSLHLADGREIEFNLHLEHVQNTSIDALTSLALQQVTMQDPLVINFGDQPVNLTNSYFEFDLLGDGEKQQYARLGGGAGYLTFDFDGDGKVTDGTELFGTKTGDAYAELAAFDEDGNGWIDENDAIFHQLKIWYDETDPNATFSLSEAGVGAIYLGQVPFDYELRGEEGELFGKSKQAGLVVMENGEVKTSQAIDLMPIIKAESLAEIQDNPEFKALQQMKESILKWQEIQQNIRQSFQFNFQPFEVTDTEKSPIKEHKSFMEMIVETIEKFIEKRQESINQNYGKHFSGAGSVFGNKLAKA